MAKGDVVSAALGAAAYQPASGIEVCVTNVSNTAAGGGSSWEFYDGAVAGRFAQPGVNSLTLNRECNVKVFITNAHYMRTPSGGSFSGIQVK